MKKGVKITLGVVGVAGLGALTYFVIIPKIKKIMIARNCKKTGGRMKGNKCVKANSILK